MDDMESVPHERRTSGRPEAIILHGVSTCAMSVDSCVNADQSIASHAHCERTTGVGA